MDGHPSCLPFSFSFLLFSFWVLVNPPKPPTLALCFWKFLRASMPLVCAWMTSTALFFAWTCWRIRKPLQRACSWIILFRVVWYFLAICWLRTMACMRSNPRKICGNKREMYLQEVLGQPSTEHRKGLLEGASPAPHETPYLFFLTKGQC